MTGLRDHPEIVTTDPWCTLNEALAAFSRNADALRLAEQRAFLDVLCREYVRLTVATLVANVKVEGRASTRRFAATADDRLNLGD